MPPSISGVNMVLTRRMFVSLRDNLDPTIAALSSLFILVSLAVLAIGALVGARRSNEAAAEHDRRRRLRRRDRLLLQDLTTRAARRQDAGAALAAHVAENAFAGRGICRLLRVPTPMRAERSTGGDVPSLTVTARAELRRGGATYDARTLRSRLRVTSTRAVPVTLTPVGNRKSFPICPRGDDIDGRRISFGLARWKPAETLKRRWTCQSPNSSYTLGFSTEANFFVISRSAVQIRASAPVFGLLRPKHLDFYISRPRPTD